MPYKRNKHASLSVEYATTSEQHKHNANATQMQHKCNTHGVGHVGAQSGPVDPTSPGSRACCNTTFTCTPEPSRRAPPCSRASGMLHRESPTFIPGILPQGHPACYIGNASVHPWYITSGASGMLHRESPTSIPGASGMLHREASVHPWNITSGASGMLHREAIVHPWSIHISGHPAYFGNPVLDRVDDIVPHVHPWHVTSGASGI